MTLPEINYILFISWFIQYLSKTYMFIDDLVNFPFLTNFLMFSTNFKIPFHFNISVDFLIFFTGFLLTLETV